METRSSRKRKHSEIELVEINDTTEYDIELTDNEIESDDEMNTDDEGFISEHDDIFDDVGYNRDIGILEYIYDILLIDNEDYHNLEFEENDD
jgi:hypothetical protein